MKDTKKGGERGNREPQVTLALERLRNLKQCVHKKEHERRASDILALELNIFRYLRCAAFPLLFIVTSSMRGL